MYHLAAEVGIPASFVELRHEATHRDMPSLVTLQRASQRALDWLWQFYWAGIEEEVSSMAVPDAVDSGLSGKDVRFARDDVRKLIEPVVKVASSTTLSIKERRSLERQSGLPIARELAKMCRGYQATLLLAQALLEQCVMVDSPPER